MPTFRKINALIPESPENSAAVYGKDVPRGGIYRAEQDEISRWHNLMREQVTECDDKLNCTLVRDNTGDPEDDMTNPDEIAAAHMRHLRAAMYEIAVVSEDLEGTPKPESAE